MALELQTEEGKWQQILRTIDASNHFRGVKVTKKDLEDMVKNFNDNVLKQKKNELQVNYSHTSWDKAAGWITDLRIKGRFLEAQIRWTPEATQKIDDEEFRYFSAEFAPSWQDVETEEVYTNVLLGAALTNIPFVPGMKPVALSEIDGSDDNKIYIFTNYSIQMKNFKKLLSALQGNKQVSLSEATILRTQFDGLTSEEQAELSSEVEAVETLAKTNEEKNVASEKEAKEKLEKLSTELAEANKRITDANLSEDAKVTQLATELKASQEASKNLQSQMDKLNLERRTEIVTAKVKALSKAGKILPKTEKDTIKIVLSQGNVEKQNTFLEYLDNMPVKVDFSEIGSGSDEDINEDAKISKINKLADESFATDKSKTLAEWRSHYTRELM